MFTITIVLVVSILLQPSGGYKHYQTLIPNGDHVQSPCADGSLWPGVGHLDYHGGGDRNPFGKVSAFV